WIRRNFCRTARKREKQYQSPGKSDSQIASQTVDAPSLGLRSRRRRWRRSSPWLRGGYACGPDLIPNFRDASGANLVEYSNHVAVHRHQAGANGDFYVRVAAMELKKARQDLIIRHILIVEVNRVSPLNLDRDIILYLAWGRSNCSR